MHRVGHVVQDFVWENNGLVDVPCNTILSAFPVDLLRVFHFQTNNRSFVK